MIGKATRMVGFLSLAALVVSGCSARAGSGGSNTLAVAATASGPFTRQFNPLLVANVSDSGFADSVLFEPLMMDDFANNVNRPWLVTSFSWGDGGRALTLNLRGGVKWSDGKPLTAEDVAFTFGLLRRHKALNAQALPLAGASAPTSTQAVITFTKPAYQALWWRTTPVPKHQWATVADPVTFANPNPVSDGPFMVKTFTSQTITMARNPFYWQPGEPKVDTLQYISYDSDSSMIAGLESGQVDWISASATDPKTIAQHSPVKIDYWVTKPNSAMVYLLPNGDTYPTNQTPVRVAISQALGRQAISTEGLGGQNQPAVSPTGLDVQARASQIAPQYVNLRYGGADPAAAKQTLRAAGYQPGPDGVFRTPNGTPLKLTLTVPTTSPYGDWVRAGQVMVGQLRAAGIAVTLQTESEPAWNSDVDLGHYQLALRSIGGTTDTFDTFDRLFNQTGTDPGKPALRNWERYHNPAAAPLLRAYADAVPGSAAEARARDALEQLMVTDVPAVPLFFTAGVGMWNTSAFTGWPGAGNPYAVPVGNSPNAELVVARVAPAGR
jgi:peptide/nickel transport system substrate-binding protein